MQAAPFAVLPLLPWWLPTLPRALLFACPAPALPPGSVDDDELTWLFILVHVSQKWARWYFSGLAPMRWPCSDGLPVCPGVGGPSEAGGTRVPRPPITFGGTHQSRQGTAVWKAHLRTVRLLVASRRNPFLQMSWKSESRPELSICHSESQSGHNKIVQPECQLKVKLKVHISGFFSDTLPPK